MSSRKAEHAGPTVEQLQSELRRVKYRKQYIEALRSTIGVLIIVATAIALAVVTLPVLRISGDMMAPTISDGDIIIGWRNTNIEIGDLIVFNGENRTTLVKRVVAEAGDVVEIQEDGKLVVDGVPQDEPYAIFAPGGECDITFPYTVPEGRIFVLGDNRGISLDSRSSAIGCIAQEQIVGRVAMKIWPLGEFEIYQDE